MCSNGSDKDADFSVAHGMLVSRTDDLLRLSLIFMQVVFVNFCLFSIHFQAKVSPVTSHNVGPTK